MFNLLGISSNFLGVAIPVAVFVLIICFLFYSSYYSVTLKKCVYLIRVGQYDQALLKEKFLTHGMCFNLFMKQCLNLNLALTYFIKRNSDKFVFYSNKIKHAKLQESKFFLLTVNELIKNNLQLALQHYKAFLKCEQGEYNTLYKTILCGAFNYYLGEYERAKRLINSALPNAKNPVIVDYLKSLLVGMEFFV